MAALVERLRNYRQRYRARKQQAELDYHQYEVLLSVFRKYVGPDPRGFEILEIGSGIRYPTTLILHNAGAHVVGIDVVPIISIQPWSMSMLRSNGVRAITKTVGRHLLFDKGYYKELEALYGKPLSRRGLDIRLMNAAVMTFGDSSFDHAYSNAVFEHIDDVAGSFRELARVLKPGAVAHISIHLYPSASGGHDPQWREPNQDSLRTTPPWDHLRHPHKYEQPHLNRLRERDYVRAIEPYFELVESIPKYEGERWLTPQVLQDLKDFSREDLLKTNLRLVLSKR